MSGRRSQIEHGGAIARTCERQNSIGSSVLRTRVRANSLAGEVEAGSVSMDSEQNVAGADFPSTGTVIELRRYISMRLSQRTMLITGGMSGIGAAICQGGVRRGRRVWSKARPSLRGPVRF
jgi:FlaA1/EpsC-like NDP-sugar epimerase